MDRIEITNHTEQGKILDFVHDRHFNLSEIKFDKENSRVVIPISVILNDTKLNEEKSFIVKRWDNPIVESNLIIKNVVSLEVVDRAGLEEGCINDFTVSDSILIINSCVPVDVKIGITDFNMILEITDNIKELKKRFSLHW